MLDWGTAHRRDLPWRHTRDPWAVLVSEVMLQQTQADRVVPHYRAFLDRFPTPAACARARPAAVVRIWSGLGYNRRALNLHRAAQLMVAEHGGAVPADERALRSLPGIGPYTARAVRSFAFGADVATVDTNAVRVLARSLEGAGLTVPAAQALADRLVPAGRSWDFNQTMFDLGATVCTARPVCRDLPPAAPVPLEARRAASPGPLAVQPVGRACSHLSTARIVRAEVAWSHALRTGPVAAPELAAACGWPDDRARADRIATSLVTEGFAQWSRRGPKLLRLR